VTLSTVGGQSLTLTGALSAGAKTATLTAVWPYITCNQLVTFHPDNKFVMTISIDVAVKFCN